MSEITQNAPEKTETSSEKAGGVQEGLDVSHIIEEDTLEETRPSTWVWLVCMAVAGVDGLLFGFDTAVLNGVFIAINDDLGRTLSSGDKELLTSITSAGAFVAALFSSFIADGWGRKRVMFFSTLTFVVGALLQAVAYSFAQMVVGRLIIGFGVGAASMIVPPYIGEIAPRRFRGRLVVIDILCITGGQLIAYALDLAFLNIKHGWRLMVGISGVPAIVLFCILPILPESPRYLIRRGKYEDARKVIRMTFPNGSDAQVERKVELLKKSNAKAMVMGEAGFKETCKELLTVPSNYRALFVACGLMAFQQFCGFNTLLYCKRNLPVTSVDNSCIMAPPDSATIFQGAGFSNPLAISITVSGTNFVFTNVSLKFIDIVGRRRMLLWSAWAMPIGLVLGAVGFHFIPKDASGSIVTDGSRWGANLVLASMMIYVAGYATGLGNVPWQTPEFFPLTVRALAATCITAFNWGPNILVSSTFLSLMDGITPPGAFGLYAAVCCIGYAFVWFFFPEAAGMPLEEIPTLFQHGFGVKYSEQLRKERAISKRYRKDEGSTHSDDKV
jgi:SP family myo-inositol transporter-like MFS transporter 13